VSGTFYFADVGEFKVEMQHQIYLKNSKGVEDLLRVMESRRAFCPPHAGFHIFKPFGMEATGKYGFM